MDASGDNSLEDGNSDDLSTKFGAYLYAQSDMQYVVPVESLR